jgi:transmembrane sensor
MFTKQKTDWSLLAKFLAGEAGEKEKAAVEKWLGSRVENRELFNKLRSEWKIMDKMNRQFDVDSAWNKLHGRITAQGSLSGNETDNRMAFQPRISWRQTFRIAASMLLLVALAIGLSVAVGRSQKVSVTTADNERLRVITLPDGSTVTMNANTSLSYTKSFRHNTRDVKLSGEAFFNVTPDKTRPFIIHTSQAGIRVVGTSFNVETKGRSNGVEVYVSTGIVKLYQIENENNNILLHPGELGTCISNTIGSKKTSNENSIAWKTGNLSFQGTRLSEAVEFINKIYHVSIVCNDPDLDTTMLSGEYRCPDEPLDTIIQVLATQIRAGKVEKSDNKIYLSK